MENQLKALRERNCFVQVQWEGLDTNSWGFSFLVIHLPEKYRWSTRRCAYFETVESFEEEWFLNTPQGVWNTYEEALAEGIRKAYEILDSHES